MLRICIYGLPGYGIADYVARGLEVCDTSVKVTWRRHDVFRPDCYESAFDIIVTNGLRRPYNEIVETYQKQGKIALITDLGLIRKEPGYYQIGINKLGGIMPFQAPSDRFDALNEPIATRRAKGKHILICGQRPGDAAHGFNEDQLRAYYESSIRVIRDVVGDKYPIVWRPHPSSNFLVRGGDRVSLAKDIMEDLADAYAVVTYNSTTGLSALLNGVPLVCHSGAYYADLAETNLRNIDNIKAPSKAKVQEFFNRVAYSQWTKEEIEKGLPFKYIFSALRGMNPFEGLASE